MDVHEMKPYRRMPIDENGEPLVKVAGPHIMLADPHPYVAAGAPYGGTSPWLLRRSVLDALNRAADALQELRPGWKILLTDALRPVKVQFFMVEHSLQQLARKEGLDPENLSTEDRARLMSEVLKIWAVPSEDPLTPPPHSTGAALDCTIVNAAGQPVQMGGEVDEMAVHSMPDHYIATPTQEGRRYHANRTILHTLLRNEGFERHPEEWWHFSLGDQLWAWIRQQRGERATAYFGRVKEA